MDSGLNPLVWKRRHLVTWAALIFLGGALGLAFAWVVSPFSHVPQGDAPVMFVAWLHYPLAYWPFLVVGAVTAGLAYYAADLLTGAR